MDSVIQMLPRPTSLFPSVISFLNAKLSTREDLEQIPDLVTELRNQCNALDQYLLDLNKQLQNYLIDYASHSEQIKGLLGDINTNVKDLQSSSHTAASSSDGGPGKILGEELPALAREVARVETVRKYAETALKLDTLVGDIEDAVSSTVSRTLRKHPSKSSEDLQIVAIRTLKQTEDALRLISKSQPQWIRLVSAVDHRVDRALAIFRPQAIADHRSLLASLGWPLPLSTLNSSNPETKKSINVHNPLLTMQGDLKQKYCESFVTLCSLQELQRQRKSRQLEGHNREVALHQPLWTIEELINPISVSCQQHFSKWVDKPEFIFALVYKVTQDFVDSMDELLQPLVDEAMLSGYSCREEWIAAMVTSLCMYLVKEIFPLYITQLDEEGVSGIRSHNRTSWLSLIDLMISFDKKVQSLVSLSGISLSLHEDGLKKISSLSVFGDRPDWLDLWAGIELDDALDKLKPDIMDERNWSNEVQGAALLQAGQESTKSPAIASAFLQHLSSVIDRCRLLPTVSLRSKFLKSIGIPLVKKFFDCILHRSQEAEGLTALTDDAALTKVVKCINASRYFETVLKEWCEDVFFLEMGLDHLDQSETLTENFTSQEELLETGVFDGEIKKLEEYRTEWAEKISTVVLRGFDVLCRDYMKNKKQWQEKDEGHIVSQSLVMALDYLQGKMSLLAEGLNEIDFVGVWRSLASRIDTCLFNGILMSNSKFSNGGVERLNNDIGVLFSMFRPWCFRPEGFFPKLSESLKLLKMTTKQHQNCLKGGENSLKENGIRHLTVSEAEKIARNRV